MTWISVVTATVNTLSSGAWVSTTDKSSGSAQIDRCHPSDEAAKSDQLQPERQQQIHSEVTSKLPARMGITPHDETAARRWERCPLRWAPRQPLARRTKVDAFRTSPRRRASVRSICVLTLAVSRFSSTLKSVSSSGNSKPQWRLVGQARAKRVAHRYHTVNVATH